MLIPGYGARNCLFKDPLDISWPTAQQIPHHNGTLKYVIVSALALGCCKNGLGTKPGPMFICALGFSDFPQCDAEEFLTVLS
jgi:hypothetical protein